MIHWICEVLKEIQNEFQIIWFIGFFPLLMNEIKKDYVTVVMSYYLCFQQKQSLQQQHKK